MYKDRLIQFLYDRQEVQIVVLKSETPEEK